MPTLLHWLVALALTFFLAYQVPTLAFVLKARRAHAAAKGRNRRSAALLWIAIPVLVVVVLAARSWVAVLDVDRPAVASSATALTSASSGRSLPSAP